MTSTAAMIEAADWHVRQPTLDEHGWECFVAWLEASPVNAHAFDALALTDRVLDDALTAPMRAANDDDIAIAASDDTVVVFAPRRRWIPAAIGGAMAAALVALVVPLALMPGAQPYAIETAPGQTRQIALGDGTGIALSGGSRITLDHANPRIASLDRGEAMFTVRHDAAKPFVLTAGQATITDLGTVFDVTRGGARTDVAVAEGSVRFGQAGASAVLGAGDTLAARDGDAVFATGTIAPQAVGGWREGRLSFSGQPMSMVALALERRYGTPVTLAGNLPDQPFTGMFRLTGSAERDIPHLAAMIGARARYNGGQWTVSSEATR